VNRHKAAAGPGLDIATISRPDHWIDDVLPRFAAMIDASRRGPVRKHLLLAVDDADPAACQAERDRVARRLGDRFDRVVARPLPPAPPEARLLSFDTLRAGLVTDLGLTEVLYIDPDTDVVEDLSEVLAFEPQADLLWVANPLPLEPVVADLVRHGFLPANATVPALVEPGFLHLRRDLSAEFAALAARHGDLHRFAPGSTLWNMLVISLGNAARRLPDRLNRTFWDVSAAASDAKSVHFTGQWKRLQPHVEYDRPARRILIHARPALPPSPPKPAALPPKALNVIMLVRDNADWLPHPFSRFEAWERAGLPCRYYILENDSTDDTAAVAAAFMEGRRGKLESRSLALRYFKDARGANYDRIMPLARMRNHITDTAMAGAALAADEWTLLLDSGIHFPEDILERVSDAVGRDPDPSSIGMITPYSQQLFEPERIAPLGEPMAEMPGYAIAGHYYDTYSLQDANHLHHFPFCGFERCRRCAASRPPGYPLRLIPAGVGIVDVASAFGGFALLPTALLRDPRLRWTTYSMGFDRSQVLVEHVVFCERLRTLFSKRVVVLQDVDCVYRL
jgi:hypothetical protein